MYQFIGQDNIYFYGIAEPAMWMAQQESETKTADVPDGELQMPVIIANHHILFLDKKASSSGAVKPPMADDLLNYYTPEQLRMHWLGLGLGQRSVSFMPKPFNPDAKPEDSDPVVKDGLLLSNVYNRMIRTAFYTTQKEFDGILPSLAPEEKFLADAKKAVLEYKEVSPGSLEIKLITGRHHQIRVQLANAGHPILGDTKYGSVASKDETAKRGIRELKLKAYKLQINHPKTGESMEFTIPEE